MIQLYSIESLPPRFRVITKIESSEVKNKLAELVASVHQILFELSGYEADLRTKTIVDNYFEYLTDSCQSQESINRRSRWLLHYGELVLDRLMQDRERVVHRLVELSPDSDNHLVTRIATLAEAIAKYHVCFKSNNTPHDSVIAVMHEISTVGGMIKPNVADNDYLQIAKDIEVLGFVLGYMVQCGTPAEESSDFALVSRLSEIRYQIIRFAVRDAGDS